MYQDGTREHRAKQAFRIKIYHRFDVEWDTKCQVLCSYEFYESINVPSLIGGRSYGAPTTQRVGAFTPYTGDRSV